MKNRKLSEPFNLPWYVHPSGYEWQLLSTKDWVLVPRDPDEPQRKYEPLSEFPGLFRTFSALELRREAMLRFANEYGPLGLDTYMAKGEHHARLYSAAVGNLYQFFDEITRMQPLVELWDVIRQRDMKALSAVIKWVLGEVRFDFRSMKRWNGRTEEGNALGIDWDGVSSRGELSEHEILEFQIRKGDLITPAKHVLQRELNRQIKIHHTTPVLLWSGKRDLQLFIRPSHLSAAMWLQFGAAISSNQLLRACVVCGRWFQIGPEGDHRADAVYCSNACRQQKYRLDKLSKRPKARRRK